MVRLFKHYVPHMVLLLGLIDFALLMLAGEAGWLLRLWQIGDVPDPDVSRLPHLLTFAVTLELAMVGVGVYGADALRSMRIGTARLVVAISFGVLLLAFVFFLLPAVTFWRSNLLYAMMLALGGLFLVRLVAGRIVDDAAFKRRVLVLGAGPRAARLAQLARGEGSGFVVVGHVAMNDGAVVVPHAINRADIHNLTDHVVRLGVSEVVLALEERRNALPLADLLRIKTTGVHVNEISSFLERETGRVDLDSLNPSWLIFSDGFSAGRRLSSWGKRLFDVAASLTALVLFAPVMLIAGVAVKLETRGPILYRQRRVGLYGEIFDVIKLRSMRTDAEVGGKAVWARRPIRSSQRLGRPRF